MFRPTHAALAALFLPMLCAAPTAALAETTLCTQISTVPTVITQPGVYCLAKDRSTTIASGAAIQIDSDDVTVDCNGRRLSGFGAGAATQAVGIRSGVRSHVTVRNCNVRGFRDGVSLGGSLATDPVGNLVEDSHFDGNTHRGISVNGRASMVRRNIVADTGGNPNAELVTAIFAEGGTDVIDNIIDNVHAIGSQARAISVSGNSEGIAIERNRIRGVYADGGVDVGHYSFAGQHLVRGNTFTSDGGPYGGSICGGGEALLVRNAYLGFVNSNKGCTDGGGNVFVVTP